jgi:predicted secreted hydrolase
LSDVHVQALDHWTSPASGARYPSRWRLTLPAEHMTLELQPLLADQELRTLRSTQVTYWEGAVDIQGRIGEGSVAGQGYVELTGYAERFRP